MYHETLNQALNAENIEMTAMEVDTKIGAMEYEQTVRFQHNGKQVALFRMPSGRYEITAYSI